MSEPVATVVLVHGAWHGAWCWAGLQAELDRRGVPSFALDLPGHGTSALPLGDLHGDAASVAEFVGTLTGDVVLVGHSYGGAVISEAGWRTPNVRHLVYLTAFVLDAGEALLRLPFLEGVPAEPKSLLGGARSAVGDGTVVLDPQFAIPALYGHCEPAVQQAAAARLGPHPLASFIQPVSRAAWREIPSTFVRCTDDRAIPITHQDAMAPRCGDIVTLDTDHSPFSSMPVETADILERLSRAAR